MPTTLDLDVTVLSGLNHIDALLDKGPDWNFVTTEANTIVYTFSVLAGNEVGQGGQQAFSVGQQGAARSALQYISALTGINFAETAEGGAAQLHLANVDLDGAATSGLCSWATSTYVNPVDNTIVSHDVDAYVYLDNVEWRAVNANLGAGAQGYETLLHELGHMLGLKHPFESDIRLPASQDTTLYTLMSYNEAGGPYAQFRPYDIAALDWMYGRDGFKGALGIGSATAVFSLVDAIVLRALPFDAAHADFAAHELHQPFRDRQAEPRSAVLAGYRCIHLDEPIEDAGLLVARDTDPGVGDGETKPFAGRRRTLAGDPKTDRATRRELDRIVQQIQQDLPKPVLVADDEGGNVPCGRDVKR